MCDFQRTGVPGNKLLRAFAIVWCLGLAVGSWLVAQRFSASFAWGALAVASGIFAVGIVRPTTVRPLYHAVDRGLRPIGEGVAFLLFALVYFSLFTLFALGLRLIGRDPLSLRSRASRHSAWKARSSNDSLGYPGQY